MKSLTWMLPLLVLAAPLAAQDSPARKIPWANKIFTGTPDKPPPVVLHDFGVLPKGTVKTYAFKMTNIYAVPVQIAEVPSANCKCVSVVEYTGQMNPRETGHILIRINTALVEGEKSIKLPVLFKGRDPKTGEPFQSIADLEVRAISRPEIAVAPGAFNFGQVPAGQPATQKVVITYTGAQPNWNVVEIGVRKDLFDHAVRRVNVPGARAAYEVTLTLKANAPAGRLDEHVELKTNEPGSQALLSLAVQGQVLPALGVVGGEHRKLNGVVAGQKFDHRVTIQADKPFKVTGVDGQGDGVTVPILPVEAAKVQVITVSLLVEKPGPVKKTLTVKTDTGKSVTLTVEGVAKDQE
jgi:hypothetical protein